MLWPSSAQVEQARRWFPAATNFTVEGAVPETRMAACVSSVREARLVLTPLNRSSQAMWTDIFHVLNGVQRVEWNYELSNHDSPTLSQPAHPEP